MHLLNFLLCQHPLLFVRRQLLELCTWESAEHIRGASDAFLEGAIPSIHQAAKLWWYFKNTLNSAEPSPSVQTLQVVTGDVPLVRTTKLASPADLPTPFSVDICRKRHKGWDRNVCLSEPRTRSNALMSSL